MDDLTWARISSQTSGVFSLIYNGVRFFFQYYMSRGKFFSAQDIIFPRYILASFSPSK